MSRLETRLVALLILIEAASAFSLWQFGATTQFDQSESAVFLAIDLASLGMILNVYRTHKLGDELNRGVMVMGCIIILTLVYASLLF